MVGINRFIYIVAVLLIAAIQFGCGERETNVPAVKLTALSVVSQADSTVHNHTASIPFTDISASPTAAIYQYRTETTSDHSHVIAISKEQMIDLNNGMKLVLTSSTPDSGTSPTHTWTILGGVMLYEKNCYNCHTNDKRGNYPMNVALNSSQTTALLSPSSMSLSTSIAATPDSNYIPSSVLSLDGASLYSANCASCHGTLASSAKLNRSFSVIKAAITANSGGMASLSALTDAQLQAISTALVK